MKKVIGLISILFISLLSVSYYEDVSLKLKMYQKVEFEENNNFVNLKMVDNSGKIHVYKINNNGGLSDYYKFTSNWKPIYFVGF